MHAVQTRFWAVRDYFAPVLRESKFKECGLITPDEFVVAGDYLTSKFPAWSWCQGEPSKTRDYLPKNKQFLMIRNVPCLRRVSAVHPRKFAGRPWFPRASSTKSLSRLDNEARDLHGISDNTEQSIYLEESGDKAYGANDDEDWILTHVNGASGTPTAENSPMTTSPASKLHVATSGSAFSAQESVPTSTASSMVLGCVADEESEGSSQLRTPDELDGLGGFAEGVKEREDPAQYVARPTASLSDHLASSRKQMALRTYDCMITYDKYYQTPRMWLLGYDEHGIPLRPSDVYEDVASDHAFKTVTTEPFPHGTPGVGALDTVAMGTTSKRKSLAVHVASIHPCKHANMMRRMLQVFHEAENSSKGKSATCGTSSSEHRSSSSSSTSSLLTLRMQRARGTRPTNLADNQVSVDMYLVLFLQFMGSIMPTMELDTAQRL